jgi:hypothetical protein
VKWDFRRHRGILNVQVNTEEMEPQNLNDNDGGLNRLDVGNRPPEFGTNKLHRQGPRQCKYATAEGILSSRKQH